MVYTDHHCGICGHPYDTIQAAEAHEKICSAIEPPPKFRPRERLIEFDPYGGDNDRRAVTLSEQRNNFGKWQLRCYPVDDSTLYDGLPEECYRRPNEGEQL